VKESEAVRRECLGALSAAAIAAELSELYETHAGALARYAASYAGSAESAQDAVQDAFMRYFELRQRGVKLKQPKAWLTRVIKNELIDISRKERRQREASVTLTPDPPWFDPLARGDELETEGLWQRLGELVSPKELACLRLRAAGHSYTEIAAQLGVREGTVSVLLSRSREKAGDLLHAKPASSAIYSRQSVALEADS
jgi:RNA polymerase sigma-70 factor (ECF subfamily)